MTDLPPSCLLDHSKTEPHGPSENWTHSICEPSLDFGFKWKVEAFLRFEASVPKMHKMHEWMTSMSYQKWVGIESFASNLF